MLLFSALLEINDSMSKDAFVKLVIEWNQGSPHHENRIPGIQWNGKYNIRYGSDTLWMGIEEYRNQIQLLFDTKKLNTMASFGIRTM